MSENTYVSVTINGRRLRSVALNSGFDFFCFRFFHGFLLPRWQLIPQPINIIIPFLNLKNLRIINKAFGCHRDLVHNLKKAK